MPECSLQLSRTHIFVVRTSALRVSTRAPSKPHTLGGSVKLAARQVLTYVDCALATPELNLDPEDLVLTFAKKRRQELEALRAAPSACSMQLATTCVLLFVGASGSGLVPLILKTSPAQLRLLSAIGAGLLVGTGLGVILPEGFEAFHTAQEAAGAVPSHMHVTYIRRHSDCLSHTSARWR